jgi:GNAT superfamily N-acetyltransferase
MADLYAPQTQFINTNGGQSEQQAPQGITGNSDVDAYLSSLPESERNAALERLTAPPSADEIGEMVKGGYSPTFEEFDAIESWHKNHEVNIIDGIGAGIEQVMGDLGRAVGAVADHPMDVLSKSPANVIEAFSQGTRNFYGMAAQSADPTSKLFRFKNFLNGSGTKEERYNQYMEALAFNRHSAELMEGKSTLVMDKDMINAEVVQAASYIADPTLFIPFGQAASAGMRAIGLGEKMMLAGAKATAIKNAVIGGTLKWGVGAPVEFLGGAVRNTIDFGIDQGARAIEATTGIGAKEIAQTARLSGLPMSAASFAGHSIPYAGAVSEAYVSASAARGLGEAISAVGDTMLKNKSFGRGINSWAREALENTPNLSGHAKGLLKVLDAVDPAFTYGAAITQGAAHGAMIGGTLGYLSGGEEGFAHGIGAGIALGAVGGGVGKGVADITNQTLYGRVAVQRKMVIEGLKGVGTTEATTKAMAFEALVKAAEGTGDRHYIAHIDGMIAGVDKVAPRSKWFVRSKAEHIDWLLKQEIDPKTGKLMEGAKLFPEFGSDRRARGRALGFLSLLGDNFAGVPDNLVKHLATLPQDHALRKAFFRLSGEQKAAVFEAIKKNADPEFRKSLGETQGVERVSDANYDKWVKDNYEYFDPSNPENNAVLLREKLKQIDASTPEGKKNANTILERIKHIEEVKKQYNDWANGTTPETRAKADAAMQGVWQGRGSRQMAEPITPKKATKPKVAEYYGDINYGEMQTARVNDLFAKGDIEGARKLIGTFLKDNTNADGSLNTRGRILRNKLAADGYFDKDGNLRPRRYTDNDAQPTAKMYAGNEGFVLTRNATGEIEVHISLDNITKDGVAHELFHAIFKESVLKPDFIDRLSKDLLGTFDKDGKLIKDGSVKRSEIREFFRRYIDLTNDKESDFKDEMARLESAIKEFETGSEAKTISPEAIATLHQYAEEFGAYYFQNWLRAQSPDFLFRGGKLEGVRGLMDSAKNGWLDFWERTMQSKDPTFDFKNLKEGEIDGGFKTSNGKRVRVSSLDYFMRDFIRATADTNRGNFDINKLSSEGQAQYIQSNGLRNTHRVESTGRAVRLSRREAAKANALAGKEIYKILKGINPNRAVDGDGNFIGRLSDAEMDAIVKSGHAPRAWVNKLKQAYEILDGKQSNVVEFGYHGKTEQTTDASYPRLFGDDVSFKHRKAILLDVELKVGEKGTFHALFHTLDKAVIEARGDNLWKDSAIQSLWDGNRGSMEQDFFRYLENASKPDHDQSKKPSAELWTDGKGGQRRDALHQMLGMAKNEGDSFINRPIAEIPLGIRHSVTTFNNDGVSSFRVSGTERYKYNHDNAFKLLSRNWKPSEMKAEKTGLGEIVKHHTGYKFVKDDKGQVRAFTSAGSKIGTYDNIEAAAKAGKAHYDSVNRGHTSEMRSALNAQDGLTKAYKPLSREARLQAIALGDVFALQEMKDFVGNRTLLRQTREEHIFQKAQEMLSDPVKLLEHAEQTNGKNKPVFDEFQRLADELTELDRKAIDFRGRLNTENDSQNFKLRTKYSIADSFEEWKLYSGEYTKPTDLNLSSPERYAKHIGDAFKQYETSRNEAYAKMFADPEYIEKQTAYEEGGKQLKLLEQEKTKKRAEYNAFETANKITLADDVLNGALETLKQYATPETTRAEMADMFAKLVKGNESQKQYSGLLEALFASDYDNQIQTGKPFVAVTTHGTGSTSLMLSRLIQSEKLGTVYNIPSSRMGSFSAGSQGTSISYAKGSPAWNMSPEQYARHQIKAKALVDEAVELWAKMKIAADDRPDGKVYYGMTIDGKEIAFDLPVIKEALYDDSLDSLTERFIDGVSPIELRPAYNNNPDSNFFYMEGMADTLTPFKTKGNEALLSQIDAFNKKAREYHKANVTVNPDAPMTGVDKQIRKVIRMDNPYVVVDPRSYEEHFISPHMKRAMEAGHDGIIFKRFADGGERDNVYVVFKDYIKDNIKVIDTAFDGEAVPRGKDEAGRVLRGGKELGLRFKPIEENAQEGGRVYDQQGKQWKTGFIGRQSEENPELTKDVSLQHIDKANGVNKLVFTDNSTGESKNIGHITWDKFGGISTHISPEFRGRGLSYLFYSEAAERMRAQGIKQSVSTIVNKEAIPVKVREAIFGDTRRFISRTEEGKPIGQAEAKAIIAAMQDQGGEYAGVTVSNKIDPNARYKPSEAVMERAKEAGFGSTVFYHGTDKQFTEFSPDANKRASAGGGKAGYFFFTMDEAEANRYAKSEAGHNRNIPLENQPHTMPVFLKTERPFDMQGETYYKWTDEQKKQIVDYITSKAQHPDKAYLALSIKGRLDRRDNIVPALQTYLTRTQRAELLQSLGFDGVQDGKHIAVFRPEQIKSAKDFTFDDAGVEIPLNERFNKRKKDIRWKPVEEEGAKPLDDISWDEITSNLSDASLQAARREEADRNVPKRYSLSQMEGQFIGRVASENPKITKGVTLEFQKVRSSKYGDEFITKLYRKDPLVKDAKSGKEYQGYTLIGSFTSEIDGNTASSGMAEIKPEFRNKGYGRLLYSEMAERLRELGARSWGGRMIDQSRRPQTLRERVIDKENARLGYQDSETRLSDERQDYNGDKTFYIESKMHGEAWYKPKERTKIGSNASSVGLLLEGLQSGRLVRTSSYKGLGLEDANLIAHTPDTAKIGQVTAGDKALVDLQGGIFYAIANGEKIWASNFSGEGETNLLVNLANKAVTNNKTGKTYIMLVKAGNDKIFASVDGARGVMSIFSHLSETGVIKEEKLVRALRLAGTEELGLKGLEGLFKQEIVSRIDDALLRSNENAITFEKRALFSRDIARQLQDSGVFKSEKAKKALIDSFHQGFAGSKGTAEKKGSRRGFSIVEMERVFGNLMAEDIIKDVPEGHAYAAIEISKPLKESSKSDHRGYDASIMHEDESPAKLILFDRTAHITEVVNKRDNSPIKLSDPSRPLKDAEGKIVYEKDEQGNFKLRQNKDKKWVKIPINEYEGEGSYISYTGGNIPYQEVLGKSRMPFKPAEVWRDWKSESTSVGSVIKNTIGYVIMNQGNKFKVYNPSKTMVGIYTDLEQAKRRVQRDEPK